MNDKRKKQLRSHWEAASPEKRAGILEVFQKHAPKEEAAYLTELDAGRDPDAKTESGETAQRPTPNAQLPKGETEKAETLKTEKLKPSTKN